MTNDKQIEAAFDVFAKDRGWGESDLMFPSVALAAVKIGFEGGYQAALSATHEQYKPLVEALLDMELHGDGVYAAPEIATEALANLPDELRG